MCQLYVQTGKHCLTASGDVAGIKRTTRKLQKLQQYASTSPAPAYASTGRSSQQQPLTVHQLVYDQNDASDSEGSDACEPSAATAMQEQQAASSCTGA